MNDNDTVFGEGKIRMTFPAVLVPQFCGIFAEIIVGGDGNGPDEFAVFRVPNDDFVLIGGAKEVSVDVDGNVAGDAGQVEAGVVQVDGVEDPAGPGEVVSVDPSAAFKVPHH